MGLLLVSRQTPRCPRGLMLVASPSPLGRRPLYTSLRAIYTDSSRCSVAGNRETVAAASSSYLNSTRHRWRRRSAASLEDENPHLPDTRGGWRPPPSPQASLFPRSRHIDAASDGVSQQYTFLERWGRSRRAMPMNPLHPPRKPRSTESLSPDDRHVSRFLQALDEMHSGRRSRRDGEVAFQMTDEQRRDVVAAYARERWWGPFYMPFRHISELQIRRWKRFCKLSISVGTLVVLGGFLYGYTREIHMVSTLSPEDRRDYIRIITHVPYREFLDMAAQVMEREDPLGALPPAALCHAVLERCRAEGWDTHDWDSSPRPPVRVGDMDYQHFLYWIAMSLGSSISGSASYFGDCNYYADAEKAHEEKVARTPVGPQMLPAGDSWSSFWR